MNSRYVHRAEGVVTPEQVGIQVVFPYLRVSLRFRAESPEQHPSLAGNEFRHLFRRPDDHVAVAERFIGNHVFRIRSALRGFDAFPVNPGVDPHPGAGNRRCRGFSDGAEGSFRAAVVVVGRCRIRIADEEFLLPYRVLFPEFIRTAVRQDCRKIFPHNRSPPDR